MLLTVLLMVLVVSGRGAVDCVVNGLGVSGRGAVDCAVIGRGDSDSDRGAFERVANGRDASGGDVAGLVPPD